jgi:hypothetical protein
MGDDAGNDIDMRRKTSIRCVSQKIMERFDLRVQQAHLHIRQYEHVGIFAIVINESSNPECRREPPVEKTWSLGKDRHMSVVSARNKTGKQQSTTMVRDTRDEDDNKPKGKMVHPAQGSDSGSNWREFLPAMILLKRQRSTGLGSDGAIDCFRRCIVISGRRAGRGAMV